jgi:hypothetical protein
MGPLSLNEKLLPIPLGLAALARQGDRPPPTPALVGRSPFAERQVISG